MRKWQLLLVEPTNKWSPRCKGSTIFKRGKNLLPCLFSRYCEYSPDKSYLWSDFQTTSFSRIFSGSGNGFSEHHQLQMSTWQNLYRKSDFFLTWQAITPTSPRTASFLFCLKELFETWQYIIGTCCSAGLMPCLPDGNSISPESRQITTSQDDVVSLRSSVEVAMVRAELKAMKALHVDKTNKN